MVGGWTVGGWKVGGCMPGIPIGCPPPPAPAGPAGGAAEPILERLIICVYSLGPCCAGGAAGGALCGIIGDMNAPVAPVGWLIGWLIGCGGGGEPEAAIGLPNMLVNSPGGLPAGPCGAAGVGAGKPDGVGNCGACSPPGGGDLK